MVYTPRHRITPVWPLVALLVAVGACGPGEPDTTAAERATSTTRATDSTDVGLESSTGDVGPVDVAARDTAASAAAGQVTIAGRAFAPPAVRIAVGESVAWRFEDGFSTPHEVAGDGFASGARTEGVFVRRFDRAGTFAYRCTIHPEMSGTIEVG